MQPDRQPSHGSQAGRRAYRAAMNSGIANLLGMNASAAAASPYTTAASPDPVPYSSQPTPMPEDETDEEINVFDMNDDMSDSMPGFREDQEVNHVVISDDDGRDGSVSQRGKKRKKGMKVGPKVTAQVGGKVTSEVWNHFEKIEVPSTTQVGAVTIMAQYKYCQHLFSYKQEQVGCTSHLGRHYKKSCPKYKIVMAAKETQTLLNYQPSNAGDTGHFRVFKIDFQHRRSNSR